MISKDEGSRNTSAILTCLVIFAISAYLSACSQKAALPEGARDALLSYWQSLPSSNTIDYQITRSWSGDTTGEEYFTSTAELEVWCVETEIISAQDQDLEGGLITWIIFREHDNTDWSAYLLAAMSASWPYEACLDGIP